MVVRKSALVEAEKQSNGRQWVGLRSLLHQVLGACGAVPVADWQVEMCPGDDFSEFVARLGAPERASNFAYDQGSTDHYQGDQGGGEAG